VHPGVVFLNDVLIPLGMSVTQAAGMLDVTRKALSEFVHEKSACSPQMALRIGVVTHTSAESWLTMQAKLDLWKARQHSLGTLRKLPAIAV